MTNKEDMVKHMGGQFIKNRAGEVVSYSTNRALIPGYGFIDHKLLPKVYKEWCAKNNIEPIKSQPKVTKQQIYKNLFEEQ